MKRLTTSEVAKRLGVGKSTVNLWCNQGKFPHAESVEESRGPVWLIPESDLNGFVKPTPGRPKSAPVPQNPAIGRNGTSTKKERERNDQSAE